MPFSGNLDSVPPHAPKCCDGVNLLGPLTADNGMT